MSDSDTPKLLDDLLRAAGPSGYETKPTSVWRDAASFATVEPDGIGSTIATVGDAEAGPTMAVVGHIDEIGIVVTHIDEKGLLWFAPIGGWDPQILVGQRVEVQAKDGPIIGVAGRKPVHLIKPDARKKAVELTDLHIDIGAADQEDAESKVRVGDCAVIAAEPVRLMGSRLVSRSMDNRLGAYTALESLRRVDSDGGPPGRMAAVAATQEEIGLFGAGTSAFQLRPDVAVAVDVTHATDAPGVEEKEEGSHPLGSGPVITRGSTLSPIVSEMLIETAEAEGIEYTLSASGRYTGTDADAVQVSRAGIPTGLVSIPLRYMHSSVEMVDLDDVEAVVSLIAAFAKRVDSEVDFSR